MPRSHRAWPRGPCHGRMSPPDFCFCGSSRDTRRFWFETLARAAERLLRIAIDVTLQAASVIDCPASVA